MTGSGFIVVLVVYDVAENARRGRLHKALKRFGTPLQLSAFECSIPSRMLPELRQTAEALIDPRTDSLRFYEICLGCRKRGRRIGQARPFASPKAIVL